MFWGKICGLNQDYYIAVAVTYAGQYEFPLKQFFYTLSNTPAFTFKEMPALGLPDLEQDLAIDTDASFFRGEPAFLLGGATAEDAEEEEPPKEEDAEEEGEEKKAKDSDESEEEEIKVPKKKLTELDRLTTVVLAIENDCQLCPVGAFRMTPEHQLRRVAAFAGLRGEQACDLKSYYHFRNVQTAEKKTDLDKPEAPFKEDFLETIDCDMPRGCWNIQSSERNDTVLIRSLNWPGY
jgi:radial spoke head protein 9